MKKFLFLFGIIVLAGGIFVGGIYLGIGLATWKSISTTSILGNNIVQGGETIVVLQQLEEGKTEDAKAFLNLKLDGFILTMDAMLPHCPENVNKHAARGILAKIAKYRSEYPYQNNELIDKKIKEILDRARNQNKK